MSLIPPGRPCSSTQPDLAYSIPTQSEAPIGTPAHALESPSRWSRPLRVAFRFSFIYLGLYCLTTQIFTSLLPIPEVETPELDILPPLRNLVFWTASHVFGISTPLVYTGSGSGDKTFDWIYAFCLLVLAALATAFWSALDRARANHVSLHKWFRLFIRFGLAGQMLTYGMAKVVPLQMPFPFVKLTEPLGDFSPMGLLWTFIGASPTYETFVGCAEMLGGLLLILPSTAMFGALVSLAAMVHVFMLNMTYDVPVKLLSFHLILLALVLLAPDLRRLTRFFLLNRAVEPSTAPPLFASPRANRLALAAQAVFGVLLVAAAIYGCWEQWYAFGGGYTKSQLYGIWDVTEFSTDGQSRPPLVTDAGRWRRAIFSDPTRVRLQLMDNSFLRYASAIKPADSTLTLTKDGDKDWKAAFTFQRRAPDQLSLEGDMDGHKLHVDLRLVDPNKFLLINRGFHWVQEYPFNR